MGIRMSEEDNKFYQGVVNANEGTTVKDVKSVFIWYDLLSVLLPFQLIFILINSIGSDYYSLTILSLFFVLITDTVIKKSLEKDEKKFAKYKANISLVKLWVIPLLIMAICTIAALLVARFWFGVA